MTTSMKLAGVCLALVAGSTVFAQQAAPAVETASSGLLGKRYVDAGYAFVDVNHTAQDAYAAGFSVNIPVAASLDVGVSYGYLFAEANSDIDAHQAAVSLTEYVEVAKGLKAFGTASLGYAWLDQSDEESSWSAGFGVEYSLCSKTSVSASVDYSDNFHGPSDDGVWSGSLQANYWVTSSIAANVFGALAEGGDVLYGVGASLKF